MKKIVSLFMVFSFVTSISFAKAYNTVMSTNCSEYAYNAANAEEAYYGLMSDRDWVDAAYWYAAACEEANGNIGDPIFN